MTHPTSLRFESVRHDTAYQHPVIRVIRQSEFQPARFVELQEESERLGYRFITRLLEDWANGSNRFALDGEVLLIAEY